MDYAAAAGGGLPAKLFADGTGGWLAHAGAGLLLIKTFTDVPKASQAPNEDEVELYLDPAYEEVENQGTYAPIAAGATATWSVRWTLRAIPTGTDVSVGSTALSDLVTTTIQ
jgi:hypothetical protein